MTDVNMLIQVNSDANINMSETLATHIKSILRSELKYFSAHITRVEIHLSDENSHKSGPDDKRCVLEVRLKNHQPIAVTYQATTLDQVVTVAAEKMKRLIENVFGKIK